MEGVGVAVRTQRKGWGNVGAGKPGAVREGSPLSHLAHSAGPGLQTVSSICAKMLDPTPSEDELKGKGEPREQVRSGRRMGAREGALGSGSGRAKGSSECVGGCYLSRSPGSVGGGLTPKHTTS